jgi:hypothetical protein
LVKSSQLFFLKKCILKKFIDFSGDSIEKEIDIVVKDIESKIVYFVDQE